MEWGFRPGSVLLGKYRVEGVLGRGGMGIVLRVTHLHLGEDLAIKILSPETAGDPDVQARFLREAQSTVRLRGEHVTRVSDVGVLPEGAPYIVMECLRGVDLSGELERRRALPPGDVVDYVLQACEALAEAHAHGIVHRDIKPSNLFLTSRPDGTALVKVLDFGISKAPVVGPGLLTRTDTVMGTPGYMSPEQMKASKDVDVRTDIWALGIVLYECLNGRRPFDADSFSAIVLRAATEPPPPMDPRIPRGLQAVVLRCLEKDRGARFPSMAELAAALAPFARDGRSAGIIVERTSVMLREPGNNVAPVVRFGQDPAATTLSGSAGMVGTTLRRRRYALGGTAVLIGAIAVVAAVSMARSSHAISSDVKSAPSDAGPENDHVATQGRTDAAGSSPTAADLPSDATPTVGGTPPPLDSAVARSPGGTGDTGLQKVADCQRLDVSRDWQKLRDCAGELAALGDKRFKDQAEAFRTKAVREAANDVAAGKVQRAVQDGNLRAAEKQLSTIGSDSVYFAASDSAYRAAEARMIEDNRRKAQEMASVHDCTGLKRFQALVNSTSTSAVAAAVAAMKCVDGVTPISPGNPAIRQPNGSGSSGSPSSTQPANSRPCDTSNVEDLLSQAANQYAAGFAKSALKVVTMALGCKQDVRVYRMAATYACAARDAKAAKAYLAKIPVQFQGAVMQRCQQESISLSP